MAASPMMNFLLQTGYVLGGLWAIYALFHALFSISWFNRLVTTLSLTHYYSRYHEPDSDLKKM
jgi:hypothetical protein